MIYLNTAGVGRLSEASVEAAHQIMKEMTRNASRVANKWRSEELEKTRVDAAYFLGTSPKNLAFIPNTSAGINYVASAIHDRKRILTVQNDFPSIEMPWELRGCEITRVSLNEDECFRASEIKNALKESKTEILVLSHVQWNTGYAADIKDICHFCKEEGIISIIDATQSYTSLVINADEIQADVVLASSYKWMNAAFGLGVMAVSSSFLEQYPPVSAGYGSIDWAGDQRYHADAKGYEPGSLNVVSLVMLSESLREKRALTLEGIQEHTLKLARRLSKGLSDAGFEVVGQSEGARSGIVSIRTKDRLHSYLESKEIYTTERSGFIRFGIHHSNSAEEIQQTIDAIQAFS
ncbi:MAG: aminotransferase class V-fold PLP-dependent enzyme [Flavobacteriales bacterium]|nr:aminotransferase class V-fold PLP-dependent enzyme [Flavobacteriales bacterium]